MVPGMEVRSAESSYGDRERADEGLRPDPAYYYYSLPQGLMGGSAGIIDTRAGGVAGSLFCGPNEDRVMQACGWSADGLIGLRGLGIGTNQHKGLGDTVVQNDIGEATSVSRRLSHASTHAFEGTHIGLHHELSSLGALHSGTNISSPVSQTSAYSMCSSFSSNNAADPQVVRSPNPCISALSMNSMHGGRNVNTPNLYNEVLAESGNLISSFSGLSLSPVGERNHPVPPPLFQDEYQKLFHLKRNNNPIQEHYYYYSNEKLNGPYTRTLHSGLISPSQYLNISSPTSALPNYYTSGRYPSPLVLGNQEDGYNVPPLQQEAVGTSRTDARALVGGGMSLGPNILASAAERDNFAIQGSHRPRMTPMDSSYLKSNEYSGATPNDMRQYEESLANSQAEFLAIQKAAYSQYGVDFVKPSIQMNGFHGNSAFDLGFPCPGNPMESPNLTIGSGGPCNHMEQTMRSPSSIRNMAGNSMGQWPSEHGYNLEENLADSLLEEFKGNKIRFSKLAEIAGHVVEFSADQYGSRFIQQKLETARTLDRNMVFLEIMPHALSLATDVFGNYVIQKLFEHGKPSQIRQLADQLIGHVLTLSLHMYGCRVIQKAIEVVKLDQQTKMVAELDGHIMCCVRDQNGNHVIQKCIEYVPEAAIEFIVTTFYDHVVTLSSHPYGCRVIQRVLEHCRCLKTQSLVMNEIVKSANLLAQDQYGNYVIQYVLEHGKPRARSIIIRHLTGQIVEMSQHKFASNVIEKCLCFGTPEERKTLVHEMLGSTHKNEHLQVMMKDQFANYVVQRVMETCDDYQLELLLNRIKVHLDALKKYTYGKHIVARVEKLVAAGERRIGILSTNSARNGHKGGDYCTAE